MAADNRPSTERQVCIYWDFENIHGSVLDSKLGPGEYGRRSRTVQDPLVELGPVVDLALTIGAVVAHRAYANWSYLHRYRSGLLTHSVELIQLFASGSGKNGADIRIALDVLDDLHRLPYVTDVVLVAGDSDYVALAQRCRQMGRRITGIGVEGSTGRYWPAACNTFKYYHDLIAPPTSAPATPTLAASGSSKHPAPPEGHAPEPQAQLDIVDAKRLLGRALQQLSRQTSDGWCYLSSLGEMMIRLDSTFDSQRYGFRSLSQFLEHCPDVVRLRRDGKNVYAQLVTERAIMDTIPGVPANYVPRVRELETLLGEAKIFLPRRSTLWTVISNAERVFGSARIFDSWGELDKALMAVASEAEPVALEDCSRVRALFYALRLFDLTSKSPEGRTRIRLPIESKGKLAEKVANAVVRNIVEEFEPPYDAEEVFYLVFGDQHHSLKSQWTTVLSRMLDEENRTIEANSQANGP